MHTRSSKVGLGSDREVTKNVDSFSDLQERIIFAVSSSIQSIQYCCSISLIRLHILFSTFNTWY